MGVIEDTYADLDADDVSEEEFREAVEAKVEQMGGLADEETAAMLIAHELRDEQVEGIADITAGMEDVKFLAKVVSVGDLRTFERDGDDEDGRVLNAEVADETGRMRVTFWDEQAQNAEEELEVGQVLRVAGRPKDGYNGVEVNVDRVEPDPDADIDVQLQDSYRVEDLSMGLSDVTLRGQVLGTESPRTFSRNDGSEGRVANLSLGDETGRVRVTLWDDQADRAEELDTGVSVEVVDGYVREREGNLELHVGSRGRIDEIDDQVAYEPDATPIGSVEIDQTVDIAGVVRSADPKRTFDRDDGSEGQVRNVRLQDDSGDIRVALWGEKADADVGPGDELLVADAEIQDGWQDDLEASAGWQATLVHLADGAVSDLDADTDAGTDDAGDAAAGLDAFAGGESPAAADSAGSDSTPEDETETPADGEPTTFTGVVVQAGDPVILDDGERTVSVDTGADVTLGQELTVQGTLRDGRVVDAEVEAPAPE
ncbi:MAG: single-stranded DNA binding protein [Haloarculaceae archaeon]